MKTEILSAEFSTTIPHAVDVLNHGGLVAFPTDTVYGLAALPFESQVVEQLYSAKGRSSDRAIAILIGDVSQLSQVTAEMGRIARTLAQRFWPGPLTLVVSRHPSLPNTLSPLPTIGVRMPDHPVTLALLRRSGPLAVTSANLSGQANTTTAQETLQQLEGRIHLIIDGGRTPGGVPSTVVDCTGIEPAVLRQGPIKLEELLATLEE